MTTARGSRPSSATRSSRPSTAVPTRCTSPGPGSACRSSRGSPRCTVAEPGCRPGRAAAPRSASCSPTGAARSGAAGAACTIEPMRTPSTLAEKIWERHVVHRADGEPDLLYVDLHLVHEVTSPQAFEGLRLAGRSVRRPDLTVATMDHNVPTAPGPVESISQRQMDALAKNCAAFGVTLFPTGHAGQGIVHVIGPQMGLTQPGMVIVCGDSHTSTHGAFGALAFGIGTSEVEHVLATQTLPQVRPGSMAVSVEGDLPASCSAKDIILAIINRI